MPPVSFCCSKLVQLFVRHIFRHTVYTHMNAHMHANMHMRARTHTHTHTHTQMEKITK